MEEEFLKSKGYIGGVYKISTTQLIELLAEWRNRSIKSVTDPIVEMSADVQWAAIKNLLNAEGWVAIGGYKYERNDKILAVLHIFGSDLWSYVVINKEGDPEPVENSNLTFEKLLKALGSL
jgi:hypothetical protein